MRKSLIVAYALCCLCAPFMAADTQSLRFYSDPSQPITPFSISEDADGNLWIIGEQGLFRFDGRRFDRIHGDFQKPSRLAVMGGRTIVIAAENGLFQYRDGKTTQVSPERFWDVTKPSDDFLFLLGGPDPSNGHTDAAFFDGTRLQVYHQSKTFPSMPFPMLSHDGALTSPCGIHPCSIPFVPEIREAARRGELQKYWELHVKPMESVSTVIGNSMFIPLPDGVTLEAEDNASWIDISARGKKPERFQVGSFTRGWWRPSPYLDHLGNLWIPGDYLWLLRRGKLQKFAAPELDNKQVTCVFEDSHGRHWFGITGHGLAVIGQEPVLETWPTPAEYGEINALTRHDPATLFAATYKGTLFRKRRDLPWEQLTSGAGSPPISQIVGGAPGSLVGFIRFGPPVRLDTNGRIENEFSVDQKTTELRSFRRIVRSPAGEIFIGSQEMGAKGLYRIVGNRLASIPLPGDQGQAQDITFDRAGRTYVGFEGGVCRVEGDECRAVISPADGLVSPKVRGVTVKTLDEIWIVYRGASAFSQFRNVNGKWTARHFTEKNGYYWPESTFIRTDRRGWIWRGSGVGLWVSDGIHVEPEDWLQITDRDGLPSPIISRFGFLEDSDGSVWIGTAAGISHLHPSESWFAAGQHAGISSIAYGQSSFTGSATFPATFESLNELKVRFSGAALLPYRYRLLPLEAAWRLSRSGEVAYPTLATGHYQLQATIGQGNAVIDYPFEVTDPVGNRNKAALAGVLFCSGFGLFAGIKRWRTRRNELERRTLPDLSELRMEALIPDAQNMLGVLLDGRFLPNRRLARGSFASVFDGHDQATNRRCAIKVFHRELAGKGFSKRFRQEVSALETISHPNVVRIYGHGSTAFGVPYLVMEFIDGMTLRNALRDGGLPPKRVASLLRQAGNALAEMHAHAIYHRDLKPDNLMLRENSAPGEELVLIDFSIAIVKRADQTMQGLSRAAGTLQYMAPEQVMGYADAASDIYSLAKIVVEMLAGTRLSELLPQAALDMPIRVREVMNAFPFRLSATTIELISSALEFDPVRRPKHASAFAEQIASDLDHSAR